MAEVEIEVEAEEEELGWGIVVTGMLEGVVSGFGWCAILYELLCLYCNILSLSDCNGKRFIQDSVYR